MQRFTIINNLQLFLSSIIIMTSQHLTIAAESHPKYNWDRNHNSMSAIPGIPSPNPTLIIQALPPGPEEELLDITSRVNRAYAKRWGFDYLSYVGPDTYAFLLRSLIHKDNINATSADSTDGNPGSVTASQKGDAAVPITTTHYYETVMVLQSDALIVKLDYNILNFIRKDSLVGCGADKAGGVWNVYSDVMIWNLNHPLFNNVTDSWLEMDQGTKASPSGNHESGKSSSIRRTNNGSLGTPRSAGMDNLAIILMEMEKEGIDGGPVVDEIPRELVNGLDGTVIKQFDEKSKQVLQKDLPKIIPLIQGISDNTCYRYYPQCEVVYF
jgi:hypothetical protein